MRTNFLRVCKKSSLICKFVNCVILHLNYEFLFILIKFYQVLAISFTFGNLLYLFSTKWIAILHISADKKLIKHKRYGLNIVLHVTIAIFFSAWLINMLISFNSKSVISTHIFVVIVQCPANENNLFWISIQIHARSIRLSFQVKNYESGTQ